eukprot:TRINITY_DN2062_c0_g1_i1.p1 TRINITY_DN2062_c0_g1~~TRINITY_DN2062_c0_g1_i1.p1  ORF type:complete len:552 (+),score=127.28 TRINITY_DN2062_c0_g1_i1:94-1749(+)
MKMNWFFFVAFACLLALNHAQERVAYVRLTPSGPIVQETDLKPGDAAAMAHFDDSQITKTGWATLTTHGFSTVSDKNQTFGAGYLEGYFTHELLYDYYYNYFVNTYGENMTVSEKLIGFMQAQLDWTRKSVESASEKDVFWSTMGLIMSQFDGLVQAYQKFSSKEHMMTELQIYMIAAAGDLENLNTAFPSKGLSGDMFSRRFNQHRDASWKEDPMEDEDALLMDCTGFIRLTPDKQDVIVGHATWRAYYAMLRIWKTYEFEWSKEYLGAASQVSMSSSPSFLHSKDDYYITNANLAVIETTNNVFDTSLYDLLTPKSLLSWQRVMIANWASKDGEEWTQLFERYNSGTYCNQWMVVNMNLFVPGSEIADGLLWIAEQIPGYVHSGDVSRVLADQGYWGSYNIPFFQDVYNQSGYPAQKEKYGDNYSYERCPRALIFKRDASSVKNMDDAKLIMRYNDYLHDPISKGNPIAAIAARADLPCSDPKYTEHAFGAVDAKLTSYSLMTSTGRKNLAVCGPTTDQQPAFQWSGTSFDSISHIGLPDRFDFDWQSF